MYTLYKYSSCIDNYFNIYTNIFIYMHFIQTIMIRCCNEIKKLIDPKLLVFFHMIDYHVLTETHLMRF